MKNIALFIALVSIFLSCGSDAKTDETKSTVTKKTIVQLTDDQFKNAALKTGKLESKFISMIVQVNGKVETPPQGLVAVSVPLGGYVKSTKLIEGMPIRKGEVLAVIEGQQYVQLQQDYLTEKTKIAHDEEEYKRQKALYEGDATSTKLYDHARTTYQANAVLVKSLEEKLKLIGLNPQRVSVDNLSSSIAITSPINGYVSAVNVKIGKYVTDSEQLFEIVNTDELYLKLTVFEKDIDLLKVGQKITASTNFDPTKKYTCTVELINRSLSNQNSSQVVCKFVNSKENLLPGMFMNAQIDVSGSEQLALPDDAIIRFGNKHFVFVQVGNKKYQMKEVQAGDSENGYTAILNGESFKNEQIVTTGAYTLLMTLKNTEE